MESWSGAMEWSLEWILEWNEVRFVVLVTLLEQDFMTDRQTVMKWSWVRFWRDSVG